MVDAMRLGKRERVARKVAIAETMAVRMRQSLVPAIDTYGKTPFEAGVPRGSLRSMWPVGNPKVKPFWDANKARSIAMLGKK